MTDIVKKWKKKVREWEIDETLQGDSLAITGDEMAAEIKDLRTSAGMATFFAKENERLQQLNKAQAETIRNDTEEIERLREALAEVNGARLGIGNTFTVKGLGDD